MTDITTMHDRDQTNVWQEALLKEFHQRPELSMQEQHTVARIEALLDELGCTTRRVGGGIVGVLANGDGPRVLFRADIDGLPVEEATGLEYASTATQVDRDGVSRPVMHACGHDVHIVTLLGATRLLAKNPDRWQGTFISLFQPGEETAEGARSMVSAGLLDAVPKPDVAFAQHVLTAPKAGHVGITAGPFLSSAASMEITVHGRGSHGSMPHMSVDPIVLASHIVLRLQAIVSREVSPADFAVVTVGSLQAGTSANVIPATATLRINVRAYDEAVKRQVLQRIRDVVEAECAASRSPEPPSFRIHDEYPPTINDAEVTAKVRAAMESALGAERVETMAPQTASEDFSVIPEAFGIPYCYWGFGGFVEGQDVVPNHNPGFAPSLQPTITTGTDAAVAATLAFLGNG